MRINQIRISGYKNLMDAHLKFPKTITALIGFNNYGKSNFIGAIKFVFDFIKGAPAERLTLLNTPYIQPLIVTLQDIPFTFEITFSNQETSYNYRLQWYWSNQKPCNLFEQLQENGITVFTRAGDTVENTSIGVNHPLDLIIDTMDESASVFLRQLTIFALTDLMPMQQNNLAEMSLGNAVHQLQMQSVGDFTLLCDAFLGLLPEVERIELHQIDSQWRIFYYQQHINQCLPFDFLSTGSQRLFLLLFSAIKGQRNHLSLLVFEEIENSIHPRLIPLLLMALSGLAGDCQIILTSHSPYLIQHLTLESITLALPSQDGASGFRRINPLLWDKLQEQARELDISIGVYIFDLLIESHDQPQELMRWLQ